MQTTSRQHCPYDIPDAELSGLSSGTYNTFRKVQHWLHLLYVLRHADNCDLAIKRPENIRAALDEQPEVDGPCIDDMCKKVVTICLQCAL